MSSPLEIDKPVIIDLPSSVGGFACIQVAPSYWFPVWLLEGYRCAGWDEERILAKYTGLSHDALLVAWEYADANPNEMAEALRVTRVLDWHDQV